MSARLIHSTPLLNLRDQKYNNILLLGSNRGPNVQLLIVCSCFALYSRISLRFKCML